MDAQSKLRESTDAHRHRSELWRLDAELLSVVPGEGDGQGHFRHLGCTLPLYLLAAKQMPDASFAFCHFL